MKKVCTQKRLNDGFQPKLVYTGRSSEFTMRLSCLLAAAALVLSVESAAAYENFIPLGQNYAPGENELPPLNSEQERINAQVDIYESEIYTKERATKEWTSQFQRMGSEQEPGGSNSDFIDY